MSSFEGLLNRLSQKKKKKRFGDICSALHSKGVNTIAYVSIFYLYLGTFFLNNSKCVVG